MYLREQSPRYPQLRGERGKPNGSATRKVRQDYHVWFNLRTVTRKGLMKESKGAVSTKEFR